MSSVVSKSALAGVHGHGSSLHLSAVDGGPYHQEEHQHRPEGTWPLAANTTRASDGVLVLGPQEEGSMHVQKPDS